MRRLISSIAVSGAAIVLAGCTSFPVPFACTAIGYTSFASIQLTPPTAGLSIELCSGHDCTTGPVEMPVEIGATSSPVATGIFGLEGDSLAGWTATLLDSPAEMGFRISDAEGVTVREGIVSVDWIRIDGTERCGGNQTADIVINL